MRVWRTLCDFKSYPQWHPYREVEGESVVSTKVVMVVVPKNGRARRLKATLPTATPGKVRNKRRTTYMIDPLAAGDSEGEL